uniref:Putative chemokine ligand 32b n=1 Tax=Ctenopharyngodon idella TaxID=7959 RepID=A0A345W5V2_CTEID|nr:putative chemokine ligand 32b [Ctenopharyngodon idella]
MRCVSITPLLATMLLAQVTCQMPGPSTCLCLKTSEVVLRKENIRSYKIQKTSVCQIDAVQFKTVRGLTFCSDPRKLWVKRAIQYVDKKKNANKTTARPKNSTSTFKTTTQLNTTSHWNRQDELGASSPKFINEAVLRPHANVSYQNEVEQQILLTLMKLKLNLLIEDLAIRFCISVSQVSRIISFWIDTMAVVLKDLIPWLLKETIRATTPEAFKQYYPNVTCILDCTESEIQKPRNLDSRSESYSHYYACNTIKYLVAIAPCGLVMFISAAYGGRCRDKFITCDSGILEYFKLGDEVMVDRGFLIRDLLYERQVNLIIPHFANKTQLTEEKVTCSHRIANVRIHVEGAIRRLKVYKVLSQTLPITLMPKIDKILRICAALVNLHDFFWSLHSIYAAHQCKKAL